MLTPKPKVRPPISYYGGKQTLLPRILPNIPPHKVYVEGFTGGGAVFWAKPPGESECLNDMNGHIVALYRCIQNDFAILRRLILSTPQSRSVHREARFILEHSEYFDDLKIAWAVWVQCNMSFSSKMFGGYGYSRDVSCAKKIVNKRRAFTKLLQTRLNLVDIECNDALKVIQSRDSADTFFYLDPPYYNSDCGHYRGYSLQDYTALLELLEKVKGKFLLSSYPSDVLDEFTGRNNWYRIEIQKPIVACRGDRSKLKTEVLTANYPIQ